MTTWILTIIPIVAIWFIIRIVMKFIWFIIRIVMKFRRLQYENKD